MTTTAIKTTDLLLRPEFAPKVLDGTKGMTRRIVKPQPPGEWQPEAVERYFPAIENPDGMMTDGPEIFGAYNEDWGVACPYGGPGDHLRFLTTWAVHRNYDSLKPLDLPKNYRGSLARWTAFDGPKPDWLGKLRPGRFMPLWMRKRLPVFELTEVRVERVRDISAEDAIAEGIESDGGPSSWQSADGMIGIHKVDTGYRDYRWFNGGLHEWTGSPRFSFQTLWESINGEDSWASNVWVWVLSFKPVPSVPTKRVR